MFVFCVKNVCLGSAAETRDHADMIDRKNSEKSKNFTITWRRKTQPAPKKIKLLDKSNNNYSMTWPDSESELIYFTFKKEYIFF